jgi:hypothetical protein
MKQTDKKANPDRIESSRETIINRWEHRCSASLVGKTIKSVRYQYTCEMKDMGWSKKSLVIFFTDGSYIFPSSDDEGNNAGTLFTSIKGLEGIPTL